MTGQAIAMPAAADRPTEDFSARLALLFDTHHQRLYRLARRLSSSSEDARDVVQETFLRAARSPASLPVGAPNEEAWLVRVLINICRDRWRRNAVQRNAVALRVLDGTPIEMFEVRAGQPAAAIGVPRAAAIERGWLSAEPDRLCATPAGAEQLNKLLELFA